MSSLVKKIIDCPNQVGYFLYTISYNTIYLFYLFCNVRLDDFFIISYNDEHKFSSIWTSRNNDAMNDDHCITKCDVYLLIIHLSCSSKNTGNHSTSLSVLKIYI